MRGVGVGEGEGEGIGVGVGVCAVADNGRLETAKPAAPSAGNSFTNDRRSTLVCEISLIFFGLFDLVRFLFIASPGLDFPPLTGVQSSSFSLRGHGGNNLIKVEL